MTKKVISEIKERFKNIEGCGQPTHKANILVDSFLGEIFSNICEQAKDLEVCKNLLSIGIQVRKISPVSSDIWIDGIDFENSQIRNNYVLLNTIMDKVIAVVRFVYSIPDDSTLEICLLESEKGLSEQPYYLLFKITGDGIEIVLDSFPMMKTGASFLAQEINSLVKKDMESMVDELCGNIPNRTINNEASNVKEKTIMKEDFINNTKHRAGREDEDKMDNKETLKPNEFIDSEVMDIHELLDNGYSVNIALSEEILNKFENKEDSIDNRLAMKEYLKSITPPMLLAEIGAKKYSNSNDYNVLSKLKVDSDANTNSENDDEFEIVLKFKKPIGLGYHSSGETTESPDVFDVRADFISKYPELKENVSIARKVDKQGDISDIMEQKLRYDAVAATATYMLHKDNPFLSSLMNLEIDDESKTDIGYAITRCRNSIVKESKK